MLGVYVQLKNIVQKYMMIKKHFLYIDIINEVRGNKEVEKTLTQMEIQIENLKRNITTYKKSL
jgi:hypothetical protein